MSIADIVLIVVAVPVVALLGKAVVADMLDTLARYDVQRDNLKRRIAELDREIAELDREAEGE